MDTETHWDFGNPETKNPKSNRVSLQQERGRIKVVFSDNFPDAIRASIIKRIEIAVPNEQGNSRKFNPFCKDISYPDNHNLREATEKWTLLYQTITACYNEYRSTGQIIVGHASHETPIPHILRITGIPEKNAACYRNN